MLSGSYLSFGTAPHAGLSYAIDTAWRGAYNENPPGALMDIKNIVVRSPNWIGDFVLSVPATRGLRQRFPDAEIIVVAHERVVDLARLVRGIDSVVRFDAGKWGRSLRGMAKFSRGISERPIDLSVVFPLSFSSALMSYLSRAKRRLGYNTELRGLLLTDRVDLPENYRKEHLSLSYARLVARFGVDENLGEPRLEAPEVCETAERILTDHELGQDQRIIGIAPYATYGPAKRWQIRNFIELVELVWKRYGARTILLGSEKERPRDPRDLKVSEILLDLSGALSLVEAAYLLKRCTCLVANDTGIAHVAAAVGTPVVSIFGSTSPEWTAPIGRRNTVVSERTDCSPCFERECRFGHYNCLQNVSTEKVLQAVGEIVGE